MFQLLSLHYFAYRKLDPELHRKQKNNEHPPHGDHASFHQLEDENKDFRHNPYELNYLQEKNTHLRRLTPPHAWDFEWSHMLPNTSRDCIKHVMALGTFVSVDWRNYELIRDIMYRIRFKLPFAWMRIGDGDLIKPFNRNTNHDIIVNAGKLWKQFDSNFLIATSAHWICKSNIRTEWQHVISDINGSNLTFLDFLYLPMGDPADEATPIWRERGINGWVIEAFHRKVVLVGPAFLEQIQSFLPLWATVVVEKHDQKNIPKVYEKYLTHMLKLSQQTSDALLFVLSCGTLAKILIAFAYKYVGYKDSFIDIGSALDAYTGTDAGDGIKRDYVNLKRYCHKALNNWTDTDGIKREWMSEKLCRRILHAFS